MAEKTIEQLQAELDEANAKLLTTEAQLNEKIEDEQQLLAINEKLQLEVEKLAGKVAEEPKKESKINVADHSFKNGDDEYGFNFAKVTRKGQVITPIEVCASKELQDELIAIKSGMIYKK